MSNSKNEKYTYIKVLILWSLVGLIAGWVLKAPLLGAAIGPIIGSAFGLTGG